MRIIFMALLVVTIQSISATEAVKLRIIHADPMTTQIAVIVDGTQLSKTLKQRQSDTLELPATQHMLGAVNAQTSDTIITTQALDAQTGYCYSVVITRESTAPQSLAKTVIVPMECKPPEAGKANATFILASPTIDKVDVYAGWFKIISNLKKGTYEGPKTVAAGNYSVVAKDCDKSVLGPIELSPIAGHTYTIVAFDNPNAADGEQLTHRVYDDDFTTTTTK